MIQMGTGEFESIRDSLFLRSNTPILTCVHWPQVHSSDRSNLTDGSDVKSSVCDIKDYD